MRHAHDPNGRRESFEPRLAALATRQHGVVTRTQIERCGPTNGLIEHRVKTGRWQRVAPGVFRIAVVPTTWRQTLMIACFVWGAGATVSHRAAAAFWRFLGFDAELVELTVSPKRKRKHGPGTIHRGLLLSRDVTVVDAIPVTTPARTLLDLGAVAPFERVEEAFDDAVNRGIVTITGLRRKLADLARSGRPRVAVMRSLLDSRDPYMSVPRSVLETRLLRHLKRRGLPPPIRQHPVHDERGLIGLIDFAWPQARLAVEADGNRWHSSRRRFEHDRIRRNRLTLLGWRIIHVTWTQLARTPDGVVDTIERALAD